MQVTSDTSHLTISASIAGTLIAGRYRLDAIIGRGGMATVWRAHDERLGRDVAVKICPPAPYTSVAEARLSGTVLHPNIVSIFDAGKIPPPGPAGSFVVMEYVDGTTAHQIAPVAWRQSVDVVRQAADGLAAIHEHGFVHCDVKPGNLLIDRRGRVLVADFGIAMEVDGELGEFVQGSPAYLAPERLAGDCASPRVDVYGLGGVLAYLITGQRPPDGPSTLPLGCPQPIAEVIGRARSTNPNDRYADARAFRDAIVTAAGRAEGGEDRVIREQVTPASTSRQPAGISYHIITHPTRVRQPADRPSAQETAALIASVVHDSNSPTRQHHSIVRWQVATIVAATMVVLLLLLVVGMLVRQLVSVDSAAAGPPVTQITIVEPR